MTLKSLPLLRIGSRASPLARCQAGLVIQSLELAFPKRYHYEIVSFKTEGDRLLDRPLADWGGKGLFTRELEEALVRHDIDLAVHSVKDMATTLPYGLILAGVLEREDPRDCFIAPHGTKLADLKPGDRIGTCSLRRASLVKASFPHLEIVPLRGNIQTRLEKLKNGTMEGTILAYAGLKRLGLENQISELLDLNQMIPAVSQGVIGIECLEERPDMVALARTINHEPTMIGTIAERALLRQLDGSCRTPMAAYATLGAGNSLHMVGFYEAPNGKRFQGERLGSTLEPEELGRELGVDLQERARV